MAKTNKEILNAIRNDASAEYKDRIPEVQTMDDMEAVLAAYTEYPSLKEEFLGKITNKIFKSVVMNRLWNNPLSMLKKGEIPYGTGIEQLFVDIATKKDFDEHFGSNAEGSLLGKHVPNIHARFIQKNFAYKYKVSLSNQRLRTAFSSENGVASLIDGLVSSVMTGANNQEFEDMLKILTRTTNVGADAANGVAAIDKGIIQRIAETPQSEGRKMYITVKKDDAKDLTEKVRTYSSELTFLSNKYNLAGVKTACNPEDLVLFTSSDMVAKLDVNVIASAFNVSAAELTVRIIKVPMDTFKKISSQKWCVSDSTNKNVTPVAILADKEAIQQYDTLIESGSFYNPDQLMTNMFVHRQGITASCDYAQTIVFGHEE